VSAIDRRTRRVLAALISRDPERDGGWISEFTVRTRCGLPALTTFQILEALSASGEVERRQLLDRNAPTPREGPQTYYHLTDVGQERAEAAAQRPLLRLATWWNRRSAAAAARLARERF
jgi:hypothetical protein